MFGNPADPQFNFGQMALYETQFSPTVLKRKRLIFFAAFREPRTKVRIAPFENRDAVSRTEALVFQNRSFMHGVNVA